MKVVVCLPTRNEIESIESMVNAIRALGLELMVVDAASTDGTQEKAVELGIPVYQRTGLGKGCGVQMALQVCKEKGYDRLALIDCDHSYPVDKLPELIKLSRNVDMSIGARSMTDIQFTHRIANVVYNNMINIFFNGNFMDINSGMRVLNVEKFHGLLDADNFDIEAQISCRALKKRYKIIEIPIEYYPRVGRSKIVLKDAFEVFFRIIREWF